MRDQDKNYMFVDLLIVDTKLFSYKIYDIFQFVINIMQKIIFIFPANILKSCEFVKKIEIILQAY